MLMYRYFPWRMMGGHLFGWLFGILVIVGIVLLIVLLASKKNKAPSAATAATTAAATTTAQDRFLTILNEQKAASNMGAAEYEERKLVLEGARGDNHANAEIVALKERYARGEITTGAYVEARNKLLGLG